MTEEQYKRSGKVAYPVVMMACGFVLLTLLASMMQSQVQGRTVIQVVILVFAMITATVTYVRKDYTKRGMIIIAGMGALMYLAVSGLNNNKYTFMYGFVILICCMSYMNRRLIIWGDSFIVLGFVIRCIRMATSGAMEVEFVFLGGVTILMCCFASIMAVTLLLKYNEESTATILEKGEQQKKALEVMTGVAGEIANRFEKASGQMDELEEAMQINDKGMQDIAGGMTTISQSIQDEANMCNAIQKNVDLAEKETEEMIQSSEKVKETLEEGAGIVQQLKVQADAVTESNQNTVDAINRLTEKVSEVENITNSILTISSQTNLLALNASIEAARAGEAGKGFAVVADEIRKLSEDTRESANQITGIIRELVADVEVTTSSMDISSKSIEEQTRMIDETKEKFDMIETEVADLIQNINETEVLMKEIITATGSINESISDLSAVGEEIAASSEEGASVSAHAVESLRNVSHELRQIRKLSEKLTEV